MDKANDRVREQFGRDLKANLLSFANVRDWEQLQGLLTQILRRFNQFKERKNGQYFPLPHQKELNKRLSQCLIDDLPQLHELTLNIYLEIFDWELKLREQEQNFNWRNHESGIALFFSGLFPFYEYTEYMVKQKFLDLVEFKMLRMKKELILSLSGFILCLIPALDGDLQLQQQINRILMETEKIVGTREFFGEIWKAMLRTPKARLPAIRYLKNRIPVSPLIENHGDGNYSSSDDYSESEQEQYTPAEINLLQSNQVGGSQKKQYTSQYTIKIVQEQVKIDKLTPEEQQMRLKMEEDITSENQKDQLCAYQYFYYPNKSKLVHQALAAGLAVQKDSQQVNRATMDFMQSHMPIDSPINNIGENTFLTESVIFLFTINDYALKVKIHNWLFEHVYDDYESYDEEDDNGSQGNKVQEPINDKDPAIICIVQAMENMFEDSKQPSQKEDKLRNLMQVLLKMFMEEERAIYNILKHLTIPLIKFFKFHLNYDSKTRQQINLFMDAVGDNFSAVLYTLVQKLEHDRQDYEKKSLNHLSTAVSFIQFTVCEMLHINGRCLNQHDSQLELGHILSSMLKTMTHLKLEEAMVDHRNKIIISSLDIIENILLASVEWNALKQVLTEESINNFNTLYVTTSRKLVEDCNMRIIHDEPHLYKLKIEIFKRYNKIMYRILKWQKIDDNQQPEWLQMLIKSSQASSAALCLDSIYYFLRILEDQDEEMLNKNSGSNEPQQVRGGALAKIKKLILQREDVLHPLENYKDAQQYTDHILEEIQKEVNEIVHEVQSQHNQHNIMTEAAIQKAMEQRQSGCVDCWKIMLNLWDLMGLEGDEDKIVEQLFDIDRLLPRIFSAVVISQLNDPQNTPKKDNAIKKFATFWRLTSQKKYTEKVDRLIYIPFEMEFPDEQGHDRKYLTLQKILGFLEDPNPTLRLSCRSWLKQNLNHFNRILEPIIEEFLMNSNFNYDSQLKTFVIHYSSYYQKYDKDEKDTQDMSYVIQNFGKLRNMILNSQDDIIIYLIARDCQDKIYQTYCDKFNHIKEQYDNHVQTEFDKSMKARNTSEVSPRNVSPYLEQVIENGHQDKKIGAQRQSFKLKKGEGSMLDTNPEGPSNKPDEEHFFNYQESRQYLDMLVDISMMFIRVQPYPDHNDLKKEAEMETVNASACEFLQLILQHVEKYEAVSNHIAQRIIWQLIESFHEIMLKKEGSLAMQDNLINLLTFILNKCNLQKNSRNQLITFLGQSRLIDTIIMGLKHDQSLVRIKFIRFVEMYVPYIKQFKESHSDFFDQHIDQLMKCHFELLQKVNISLFSVSKNKPLDDNEFNKIINAERTSFIMNKRNEQLNLKDQSNSSNMQRLPKDMQINQESDIVSIIGGLKCILHKTLGLREDELMVDTKSIDEELQEILTEQEMHRLGNYGVKLKIERNEENNAFNIVSKFLDNNEKESPLIKENMRHIFNSCIFCWNHSEFFNWSDYHFTRHGIFGFQQTDYIKVQQKLRTKGNIDIQPQDREPNKARQQPNDKTKGLDDIMMENYLNPIQKQVIEMLRPIAEVYPNQFMEGALEIWMAKSKLPPNVDIKRCYEKLIQILVCVYKAKQNKVQKQFKFILSVETVIQSIITFISQQAREGESLVNIQRWTKKQPQLDNNQTTSESLLNAFLYTYLLYSASMYDPILTEDVKIREYKKVFQKLFNYFHVFKQSHNPFTINWMLEILNICSIKYGVQKEVFDHKLKKEYNDFIMQLLTNCSLIISDQFNIEFSPAQQYAFALPPTVYEFLWRLEYIQSKHMVKDTIADFGGHNSQVPMQSSAKDLSSDQNQIQNFSMTPSDMVSDISNHWKIKQKLDKRIFVNGFDNESNSIFFDQYIMRVLKESNFEYQHKEINKQVGSTIFKDNELLMTRASDPNLNSIYFAQSNFVTKIRLALRNIHYQKDILVHSKFFTILTLKQLLCQFIIHLQSFEEEEKKFKILQIILKCVIEMLYKNHVMSPEDKQKFTKIGKVSRQKPEDTEALNEILLEFFAYIVETMGKIDPDQKMLQPQRKMVNEIFNSQNFFQTSLFNQQQWMRVIKSIQTYDSLNDTWRILVTLWQNEKGVFQNQNQFHTHRCNLLKRISFIVFGCDMDQLNANQIFEQLNGAIINKLKNKDESPFNKRVVKENMINLIKERIFIFFAIRVALIRQDTKQLIQALKSLWPHLLSELVSVFEVNRTEFSEQQKYYTNKLTIEAIKLIELLSSLNLEDFQMSQWIFLVDKIGMRDQMLNIEDDQDLVIQPQSARGSTPNRYNMEEVETFKTFIVKYVGPHMEYTFNNVEDPSDGLDKEKIQTFWTDKENHMDEQFDEITAAHQSSSIIGPSNHVGQPQQMMQQEYTSQSTANFNNDRGRYMKQKSLQDTLHVDQHTLSVNRSDPNISHLNFKMRVSTQLVRNYAQQLQKSIDDQKMHGHVFDRFDAFKKIEKDFNENSEILN